MQQAVSSTENDLLKVITDIGTVDASLLGIDFLNALMCRATTALGFDYGLIGIPDPNKPDMVNTLVMVAEGQLQQPISYALRGTPCENVYGTDRVCVYCEDVHRLFPEDALLEDMHIRSYMGAPLLAPDGSPLGVFVFMHRSAIEPNAGLSAVTEYLASRVGMELMRDATRAEQKRAEEREQRQDRLAALGTVVSGVAHDFNNLLAGMQGHSDLLRRKANQDNEVLRHLDGINQLIQRAQSTTRTLLDFSSDKSFRPGTATVKRVFDEVASLTSPSFPSNIRINLQCPTQLPQLKMEEGHFHQVLLNLVLNARDALPEGGDITLVALSPNDPALRAYAGMDAPNRVAIQVRDNGTGIDSAIRNQIFDPFFSTKDRDKGTGLGLTGVHHFVTTYGGTIFLDSELNKGTQFTIVLPCTDAPPESTPMTSEQRPISAAGSRILLAEDEEAIAELTEELLSSEGYDVTVTANGDAAFEAFQQAEATQTPYDLVITDVNMPGRNGFQLLSDIRAQRPDLKAIICTGDILSEESQQLSDSEDCLLLEKPYTIDSLLSAIASHLSDRDQP